MIAFDLLLSVAAEKSGKLLSVAACVCEDKIHFSLFSNWQHLKPSRPRKQQLAATGNRPSIKGWVAMGRTNHA